MPVDRADVAMIAPYPRLGMRHGGCSGVASYAVNLARALTAHGVSVTVISPQLDGEPADGIDGGVRVRRAFSPGPWALPAAMAAARATGAPVVHLQHELFLYGGAAALPGLLGALAAPRVARDRVARTVVTMHQVVDPDAVDGVFTELHRVTLPPGVARFALSGMQRAICSLADAVVVHEPAFAEIVPGAVRIPHGVESVRRPAGRANARRRLGLDDGLVALCFGFVAPYKGLEVAIAAARLTGPTVQLVVAGGSHPRLEQRHGYAQQLRRDNGDVARFTGFVADDDVADWFTAADVVVLPYPQPHASSGPLALAIAYGTPVLASTALAGTCGLPEQLTFTSALGLAERLEQLSRDESVREQLTDAVVALGSERDWDTVAKRHLDLYATAVAA